VSVPNDKLILHVGSKINHLIQSDSVVTAATVQPEAVHRLLLQVKRVAKLIIENLVSVKFTLSDELQLATEIRNLGWV